MDNTDLFKKMQILEEREGKNSRKREILLSKGREWRHKEGGICTNRMRIHRELHCLIFLPRAVKRQLKNILSSL